MDRKPVMRWLGRRAAPAPPSGTAGDRVEWGTLRRLEPVSRSYGFGRGTPVDRVYIESFLAANAGLVRGRVLEVGDDTYTRRFGGERVARADVLHVKPGNPAATFVDDLAVGATLPSGAFDCVILTQTLQLVFDLAAAVRTLHRILAPGGHVLATVPGITQLSADEWASGWYWSFTSQSAARLFGAEFPPAEVAVEAHGNVLAAVAFLEGIAAEELDAAELAHRDPLYELLVTVRAEKPGAAPR